ncbi:MAG: hypothetical protein ACXACB_14465, partial [Promethearchaeota archaeon]
VIEAFAPVAGVGERFVWEGWSGSGSGSYSGLSNPVTIIVDNPNSQNASWQNQFLFNFDQEGLPIGEEAFLIFNSENESLPFSVWVDEGETIQFVYPKMIQSGSDIQYTLISNFNQSILLSDSPNNLIAFYELQHNTNSLIAVTIILIIGILLFLIIFFKKKKYI